MILRKVIIDTNLYIGWMNQGLHEDLMLGQGLVRYLSAIVLMELRVGAAMLPAECGTLSVSPMLREMILRVAELSESDARDAHVDRLVRLMLDELALMPREGLELPISDHPKIALIAAALLADPSDRRTLGQWAEHVAVSERSLKRLMVQQTGLSFGRWRRQLHLVIALRELAGGATVQQVAGDLGYESTTAFIVMFRKALGTTPSRYFADRLLSAERA